jgi:hypothetical protein
MTLTYELVRECLNNAEDAASDGRSKVDRSCKVSTGSMWPTIRAQKRVVSCGTHEQNTAQRG